MEGHLPAGYSASPSPPSLPYLCTWQCPGVSLALPRMQAISNRTKQCSAKDIRKNVRAHVQMNAESSVLPACLLPWPRAAPSWCFFLTPGGREKPEVPAESWATNAGGTLSSLIFQDYFTIAKPPATCNH